MRAPTPIDAMSNTVSGPSLRSELESVSESVGFEPIVEILSVVGAVVVGSDWSMVGPEWSVVGSDWSMVGPEWSVVGSDPVVEGGVATLVGARVKDLGGAVIVSVIRGGGGGVGEGEEEEEVDEVEISVGGE